jgi:hypothetical protein
MEYTFCFIAIKVALKNILGIPDIVDSIPGVLFQYHVIDKPRFTESYRH